MSSPFQEFAKRLLTTGFSADLLNLLPKAAREALSDVRAYVADHGRLPKLSLYERAPAGPDGRQAVNAFHGRLTGGERLSMANVFLGSLHGGELRSTNVAHGDVESGAVQGVNALIGDIHGGVVERVNVIVGDVHGGEVRIVNVLAGDVHGGRVQCHLLIGDIHGGEVQAKHHRGRILGGRALVDDTGNG